MGNSLQPLDGCCMFTEEKQKYSEYESTRSTRIITSNPASYSDHRQVEHVEYLGYDAQPFPGSAPYYSQTAAANTANHRDSRFDLSSASYASHDRDNENDLPYGYVKDFHSERAAVYNSVDYAYDPSKPYTSGPAYPELDQLTETPRMSVSTIRFEPANDPSQKDFLPMLHS
jgi:hypothetical protein